jgi:hypothetical protein
MTIGNDREFSEAWRALRETFVRKLARKYYGIEISELGIRSYDVTIKPLTAVLDEIKRKNIFESTMFRAGRRIRIILKRNSVKRS